MLTVASLLEHFEVMPKKINLYYALEGTKDVVHHVMYIFDGEEHDYELYNGFVYEYGQKEVTDWTLEDGRILSLEAR